MSSALYGSAPVGDRQRDQATTARALPWRAGREPAVTIVVPHGNSVEKNAAMRAFGAELVEHGRDFDDAKQHAATLAEERGFEFVPSFHSDLVTGVATYARELFDGAPDLDVVYAPIGLGSGICGLIRTRDLLRLKTEIVGVVPTGANAYRLSFEAGRVVPVNRTATFADGAAVRVPDLEALAIIRAQGRIVEVTRTKSPRPCASSTRTPTISPRGQERSPWRHYLASAAG